jgi:microcystin degradation protein MlrC
VTGRKLRVAVGGFAQESNSFTGIPTTLADFEGRGGELRRGEDLVREHHGVNTVLGGFVDGLLATGHEILPTMGARACPGGPLDSQTYRTIRDDLLLELERMPYDALLLSLHGAMVAEGEPDPEGDILRRVREHAGDRPVVVVLDMHANVSPLAARLATAIVGYRTYPHIDMADSGLRAVKLLEQVVGREAEVHVGYRRLPLMLPSINMRTDDGSGPMAALQRGAQELVADNDELLELSLFAGFPYADVPCSHASVLAFSTRDQSHADSVADEAAERFWVSRKAFEKSTVPAEEAVRRALSSSERPFVLADVADNPGSGGTGETTTLLRLLLEHGARNAFVGIIHDPEAVKKAFATGVGERARFSIGGKIEPRFGAPVLTDAVVQQLSDGEYTCAGPMLRGKRERLGRSALLRVESVLVAVTEGRASVNDPNMLHMLGVDPTEPRVLALKVKGHFRAAFGPLVARIIDAEAPGASMTDFTQLPFRNLTRPLHPFDPLESWRSNS